MRLTIPNTLTGYRVISNKPCTLAEIQGFLDGTDTDRWLLLLDNTALDYLTAPRIRKAILLYGRSAAAYQYLHENISFKHGLVIVTSLNPDSVSTLEPAVIFRGSFDLMQSYADAGDLTFIGGLTPADEALYQVLWNNGGTPKRIHKIEVVGTDPGGWDQGWNILLYNVQTPSDDYVSRSFPVPGGPSLNVELNFGNDTHFHENLAGACVGVSKSLLVSGLVAFPIRVTLIENE